MRRFLVASAVVAAMGCSPVDIGTNGSVAPPGPSDGGAPGGGSPPGAPSLVITSPLDGTTLAFDNHADDHFFLDVAVNLQNVRVAADCGGDTSCGALLLFIDDDRCGNPNASASQGNRATADFARCGANVDGAHRLRADVWRGSTLVARSPEIHVDVRRNGDNHDGGDDHGDDDGDHGDDHGGRGDDLR
jgi:hypothetical protein